MSRRRPTTADKIDGEEWRSIAACPAYEVSSLGRVRRATASRGTRKGMLIRAQQMKNGYLIVHLRHGHVELTKTVHRLVAEAFIGPVPAGLDVCHKDGTRTNNEAANLRFDTRTGNMADAVLHGTVARGERIGTSRVSELTVIAVKSRLCEGARNCASTG